MNLKTKLKAGNIVDIYTDYQDELPESYEGKAILIKKIRDGDSFYRKNEQLKIEEKKHYNKTERLKIEKYNKIKNLFKGGSAPPEKEIVKFRKDLLNCRKDNLDDIENMNRIITLYKDKYDVSAKKIKTLLNEFDNDYIIRYIQQDREKWQPTIFTYER